MNGALSLPARWTRYAGGMSLLASRAVVRSLRPPYRLRPLVEQMDRIGVQSLPIVCLASLFTGFVLALQTMYGLGQFGAKTYVAAIVGLSMVRELGPVLTALLVGGRVSSGFTAELGAMNVTEQLDALRAMGVDSIKELVVPRVLAAILVFPLVTALADVLGIVGGMAIATLEFGLDHILFVHRALAVVKPGDILSGLGKSAAFGFVVAIVGCHHGLEASEGAERLGRTTTMAVVSSSLIILVADFFLTKLFRPLEGW